MDKIRIDAENREREELESMKIKLFEKEIERLTKLIHEADEKNHKRRRTLTTNDCTPSCGDTTTNLNHGKVKQQPRTLLRGTKRRAPCCCEFENDQQREITKLKRQRLIAALKEVINDTARRREMQSVSSDSVNITPQQTTVETLTPEEGTANTKASKPTTPEAFAVESGTSKEPVPEAGQCKEVKTKGRPRKEKAPKAGKCKEVRPRGRPRKETAQKGSESKKVTRRGCPSNETIPKAKESKKVTKRVSPRNVTKGKAEKGKIGTWLIDARKKGRRLKNGRVNSNLRGKKLAGRLKYRIKRAANWEFCEREALKARARLQFTKEMKRIAIMLDEADEKAANVHIKANTNDSNNATQNLNAEKATLELRASKEATPKPLNSRKSVKIKCIDDHKKANANFQNSLVEQFQFPSQTPPVTEFPNPTVNGLQNPIVIQIQNDQIQNFPNQILKPSLTVRSQNSSADCIENPSIFQIENTLCQFQNTMIINNFAGNILDYSIPLTRFQNSAMVPHPLIAETVVHSNHGEQRDISEESIFLQNGGIGPANIEAELPLKSLQANVSVLQKSTEHQCGIGLEDVAKQLAPSDDDAILQNSNDSIIAFQVNTQPALDFDAGFAQLSNIDETPFLHNSSDLISAYIQIKTKPESNDDASTPYLQGSNDSIIAFQVNTQPASDYDAGCAQLSNIDETPFLQNSSDLISAYIQIKTKPESNDDASTSYLPNSNDSIDAIQVNTQPASDYDAGCAQLSNEDASPFLQNSSGVISAYIQIKTKPESNDDASTSYLQKSNDSIIAFQVDTQPASDYYAACAQLSNINETPFLQNSSDLISPYIQIKTKSESNDDASTSYLQCSNEAIDAIQIKTEPPPENDPICAQLWKRYETVPLSQDSNDLISAYIKVKTEPESNDAKLQRSNDATNATTVE